MSIGAVALVCVIIQIPGLVSAVRIEDSSEASRLGFEARAEELASEAIEAAPWAASPYVYRATLRGIAGDTNAAIEDARVAVEREPLDFMGWLVLAELYEDARNREDGELAYKTALGLAPTSSVMTSDYARDLRERIEDLPPDPLPP